MERSQFTDISNFTIQGRLLRLYGKHAQNPKALRVETSRGKYRIQLSKALRKQGCQNLVVGEWVWITGYLKSKSNRCKLKALEIRTISSEVSPSSLKSIGSHLENSVQSVNASATVGKVLICQKSSCVKRGAKAVKEAVETEIANHGLDQEIKIKITGCMGHCKKGPVVVVMPGKQRYQKVKPEDVSNLMKLHCFTENSTNRSSNG